MARYHQPTYRDCYSTDEEENNSLQKWIVLISCFMAKLFIFGLRKCLGVLLPSLQIEFGSEVWIIGSIVAVVCGVGDLIGPIVGVLARRFSYRSLVMTGGILMCLGLAVASRMNDVFSFAACLVIFCGIGLGLTTDTPFVVLAMYFTKDYGLANGFAFLGSSAALIVFSTLTQILNETYGWSGAVLILASIFFHLTLAGAILRPPSSSSRERPESFGYEDLSKSSDKEPKDKDCLALTNSCFLTTFQSLHLSLFKEPIFYVIILVSSTIRFTHTGWVIYQVPNVQSKGIAPLRATLVATMGGIGDATGKIIPGLILWKGLLNSSVLWICGMTILSLSLALDFLVTSSFPGMLVLGFCQGLGLGMSLPLNNVVIKDVFGTEKLINAMGWTRCFAGVARLLGGFAVGWMYSSSGHYGYGFAILGCVQGLGMLVFVIGKLCIKHHQDSDPR